MYFQTMRGSKLIVGETQRPVGGISPLDWEEVNSILDEATGLTYVDNPALHDPSRDIILYDPNIHLHVFDYVTIGEITYPRCIMLEDWDEDTMLWDPWTMGMWPFGTPLTLEFEVWSVMEKMKDEVELILLDEEEEEDWNFESDNESDDDYVSDQGYISFPERIIL